MSSAQEESRIYGAASREEDHQPLRPTDLSELLKEGIMASHDAAQNTNFMKDFLKGRIKRELFKELHRAEALQKDLVYFYGEDWKDTIQCFEATQAYVDRIRYFGLHKPELLVAHAYTRYMGDLSGGQILKKVAQRALHLPSTGEGIQFYMFDDVTNAYKFKQLYRARLNTLELNAEAKEDMVEEAKKAFQFNMQLFEELDKIGTTLPDEAQDGGEGKGDL
ncbi:heme oxygenase 2-like isoform X2 [Phyllobates terribilis]|uniref:heme oxygenase 2-like isoform X2 n=1 Tax=Phyllobates terribilis TaxID=111132 RepID=UPI003CCB1DD6